MFDHTGMGRVVLGLDGFALTDVELVGGEARLHVETDPTMVNCPDCGTTTRAHGWRSS